MELKDFRGREIKVGSIVAWPGRYSSSLWMTSGRVKEIREVERSYGWRGETKKLEPLLIVEADGSSDGWRKKKRDSRIEVVSRVVVVEEAK